MLGKASEIKTKLVQEYAGTTFDITLDKKLNDLGKSTIIDIQFKTTTDSEGVAWYHALIIYKEGESNAYTD